MVVHVMSSPLLRTCENLCDFFVSPFPCEHSHVGRPFPCMYVGGFGDSMGRERCRSTSVSDVVGAGEAGGERWREAVADFVGWRPRRRGAATKPSVPVHPACSSCRSGSSSNRGSTVMGALVATSALAVAVILARGDFTTTALVTTEESRRAHQQDKIVERRTIETPVLMKE